MKCTLKRTGEVLAQQVEVANTFYTRLKGLMFRRELKPGNGLLLDPCPQIHTCFMRFSIDAIFFDKNGLVLYIAEQMKPWRFGRFVRGSRYTLELPGGSLAGRVRPGDEIILSQFRAGPDKIEFEVNDENKTSNLGTGCFDAMRHGSVRP